MNQTEEFRSKLFQLFSGYGVQIIGSDHTIILFDGTNGKEQIKLNNDGVFAQFVD